MATGTLEDAQVRQDSATRINRTTDLVRGRRAHPTLLALLIVFIISFSLGRLDLLAWAQPRIVGDAEFLADIRTHTTTIGWRDRQ